jgi:hypothetical protein
MRRVRRVCGASALLCFACTGVAFAADEAAASRHDALIWAAASLNADAVRVLVENGADIHAQGVCK